MTVQPEEPWRSYHGFCSVLQFVVKDFHDVEKQHVKVDHCLHLKSFIRVKLSKLTSLLSERVSAFALFSASGISYYKWFYLFCATFVFIRSFLSVWLEHVLMYLSREVLQLLSHNRKSNSNRFWFITLTFDLRIKSRSLMCLSSLSLKADPALSFHTDTQHVSQIDPDCLQNNMEN